MVGHVQLITWPSGLCFSNEKCWILVRITIHTLAMFALIAFCSLRNRRMWLLFCGCTDCIGMKTFRNIYCLSFASATNESAHQLLFQEMVSVYRLLFMALSSQAHCTLRKYFLFVPSIVQCKRQQFRVWAIKIFS